MIVRIEKLTWDCDEDGCQNQAAFTVISTIPDPSHPTFSGFVSRHYCVSHMPMEGKLFWMANGGKI